MTTQALRSAGSRLAQGGLMRCILLLMPEGPEGFNWLKSLESLLLPGGKRLMCPHCRERTLYLIHYLFQKPWERFVCPNCRAIVRQTLRTRVLVILAIGLTVASYVYTFPWISGVIDGVEGRIAHSLVKIFLPMIVISVQTIVVYTPLAAVAWLSGELELVEPPQ